MLRRRRRVIRAAVVAAGVLISLTAPGTSGEHAWAVGCTAGTDSDFNGDGIRDVTIADPLAAVAGKPEAGVVHVVYGGGKGTVQVQQDLDWVPGSAEAGDRFGHALAAYDANKDGCSDLAVGVPYENIGTVADAGTVNVIYGSPSGLGQSATASRGFDQSQAAFNSAAEKEDWFGYAIAAGTSTAGQPFLIAGSPGEDLTANSVTVQDAGTFTYLYGTSFSIAGASQDSTGVGGVAERDDRFGSAISATPNHFVVGAPGEAVGTSAFAGGASVFGHTVTSGVPHPIASFDQQSTGLEVGAAEPGDGFGTAVAMAPYRPSGAASATDSLLAIGSPGEDIGAEVDTGMVSLYQLSAAGVLSKLSAISQYTADVAGASEAGDRFGQHLAAVNTSPGSVSSASTMWVTVGIPGEDVDGVADTGGLQVFPMVGAAGAADHWVGGDWYGIPGPQEPRQYIGTSFSTSKSSLYLGVPYGGGATAGVHEVPWADITAGGTAAVMTWKPGADGIPAGGVAFGAALQ